MPKKILISEFMDETAVALLARQFEVTYDPLLVDHPDALLAKAAEADALIVRNRTQVRGDLLAALRQGSVIGRLGVGLDNIDVTQAAVRGIQVIPATGANARSVAEYVITAALVLLRGSYFASAEVAAGDWPRSALSNGREIGGRQLGLIGFGSIGQLTAQLARALGVKVQAYDPALPADAVVWQQTGVQSVSLDVLLASSDIISLHVPLSAQTRNLLDATRLTQAKQGAIVINTARGGVIDEQALADALRSGHLGGAAIDVFNAEPLPAGNVFADVPNLLLTPHIAGVTQESNERVSHLIAEKVAAALQSTGEPYAKH
jgi:(S)-sulfolactate dehydrogenase